MREILPNNWDVPLQVDEEDYWWLSKFKWRVRFTKYGVPKLIEPYGPSIGRVLLNSPQGLEVDHIDYDPFNNRKDNLQAITKHENLARRRFNGSGSNRN